MVQQMRRLKNADKLLADIVSGLHDVALNKVCSIEVRFFEGPKLVRTQDLIGAFDAINNDLFFDENGDFSAADRATVGTI